MKRRAAWLGAALFMSGCASAEYYRPGSQSVEWRSDYETCRAAAKSVVEGRNTYQPYASNGAELIGIAIGSLIVGAIEGVEVANSSRECMQRRGYVRLSMTGDEGTIFSGLKSDEDKVGFLARLYQEKRKSGEITQEEAEQTEKQAAVTVAQEQARLKEVEEVLNPRLSLADEIQRYGYADPDAAKEGYLKAKADEAEAGKFIRLPAWIRTKVRMAAGVEFAEAVLLSGLEEQKKTEGVVPTGRLFATSANIADLLEDGGYKEGAREVVIEYLTLSERVGGVVVRFDNLSPEYRNAVRLAVTGNVEAAKALEESGDGAGGPKSKRDPLSAILTAYGFENGLTDAIADMEKVETDTSAARRFSALPLAVRVAVAWKSGMTMSDASALAEEAALIN